MEWNLQFLIITAKKIVGPLKVEIWSGAKVQG
jgi:hypothetical protein